MQNADDIFLETTTICRTEERLSDGERQVVVDLREGFPEVVRKKCGRRYLADESLYYSFFPN